MPISSSSLPDRQLRKFTQVRGVRMVGPNDGPLAEGESGPGRMAEPADIVAALAVPA